MELQRQLFPFVEPAMEACDKCKNPTLWMFLTTLCRIRVSIIQDAAVMSTKGNFLSFNAFRDKTLSV